MKFKKLFSLCFLLLFLSNKTLICEGFDSATLISTSKGLIPIEKLQINNFLESWVDTKQYNHPITHVYRYTTNKYVKITIADLAICTAPDQQFYSITRNKWIQAKKLKPLEILMCADNTTIIVDAVELIHTSNKICSLTIETSHTYCVSPYKIIAHNFEPVSAGWATAYLSYTYAFPPLAPIAIAMQTIIGGICGYFAYKTYKKNKTFAQITEELRGNSNSSDPKKPNDNDDDDENEHPHGIYKDAEYHNQNSKNDKSPNPQNGQRCLDFSIPIKDGVRICIEKNKFVVLRRTLPKEFHGYVVKWKRLHQSMKNVLTQEGYTTLNGKIIKRMTEKVLI